MADRPVSDETNDLVRQVAKMLQEHFEPTSEVHFSQLELEAVAADVVAIVLSETRQSPPTVS